MVSIGRATALALAALLAGCSMLPAPTARPTPPPGAVVARPAEMSLTVGNLTTIGIKVSVNGLPVATVEPGEGLGLGADELPPLPWDVQSRTRGGRLLLELTVRAGDVWTLRRGDVTIEEGTDQAVADLSCGRLEIYSGSPPAGPAVGHGAAGDCG